MYVLQISEFVINDLMVAFSDPLQLKEPDKFKRIEAFACKVMVSSFRNRDVLEALFKLKMK